MTIHYTDKQERTPGKVSINIYLVRVYPPRPTKAPTKAPTKVGLAPSQNKPVV